MDGWGRKVVRSVYVCDDGTEERKKFADEDVMMAFVKKVKGESLPAGCLNAC